MDPLPLEQYRLLVEHAPTLVWRSGLDGGCDYFNETWLQFTGRALADELGDGWIHGVHPEDVERCAAVYRENFARRTAFEMEYRLRRRDGQYRWIFDRGVPYDASGTFAGFIGSCVDVHERRVTEEERTTYLALLAHELRTPITSMRAAVDALGRGAPLERAQPLFERQLQRLTRLARDLGELGLAGKFTLEPQLVDAAALVRSAPELVARRGGRELVVEVPDAPLPIRADADRLRQVLENLIDNALKYSPEGGPVRVRAEAVAGGVRISVHDRGIGIPVDDLPNVTRRFARGSNAPATGFPGLGLGLAIARELVENHGGTLSLDSEVGRGTTVTVELPSR